MTRRRDRSVQDRAAQPVGTRRAAREFAFRALFEADRGDLPLETVFTRAEGQMREGDDTFPRLNEEAMTFARQLVDGLQTHRAAIDETLHRTIRGWSFGQMAQTDLNVLRLAAFEMGYTGEPHPPVIESAVRIARKFGGDDSGKFVNGVLAGLSRSMQTAPAAPQIEEQEPEVRQPGGPEERG
ncbi:transcription antitermination factor NusB [Deinococcus frigens]|uniref:transcription antitermination factor NusB n=1 Tax=Deinococcus frigens TaxID=249403 RepID=UPI00068D37E2|nr:transcription antitermination factor NusB [Deinococcus frigens]